jgi:hypothetical protein
MHQSVETERRPPARRDAIILQLRTVPESALQVLFTTSMIQAFFSSGGGGGFWFGGGA